MLPVQLRNVCVAVLCAVSVFAVQSGRTGYANPPAKKENPPKLPTKPKGTVTPKPNPPPTRTSNSVTTPVRTPTARTPTVRTPNHHTAMAGMAHRSHTWQTYHHHHRWVYEVRFRSLLWHSRTFASLPAASTFMVYLREHHFQRFLLNPVEGIWTVTYRTPHSRHFGTYASLPVARRVEDALTLSGFPAWVVSHRWYYW
jgi:hypothetical protein